MRPVRCLTGLHAWDRRVEREEGGQVSLHERCPRCGAERRRPRSRDPRPEPGTNRTRPREHDWPFTEG